MKTAYKKITRILPAASLLFCAACDPVTIAFTGTAAAGAVAVRNDGGLSGGISDTALEREIEYSLAKENLWDYVELAVKHEMVIVIGYVKDESQREKIMKAVKDNVKGRIQVFYEIQVGEEPSASDFISDSALTSRIRSSWLADGNVSSPNYDMTTVKGVVYICGTAQTKFERDVVINHARSTSGIERVVAYIKIKPEKQNNNGEVKEQNVASEANNNNTKTN
ncbi:MAG: BON domain-containing protein [Holosporaceae bacterium]|jgi:osmotically-inducible protein OsmY|nr:BON domain-containing protein [Holosporaceae bacterium]